MSQLKILNRARNLSRHKCAWSLLHPLIFMTVQGFENLEKGLDLGLRKSELDVSQKTFQLNKNFLIKRSNLFISY